MHKIHCQTVKISSQVSLHFFKVTYPLSNTLKLHQILLEFKAISESCAYASNELFIPSLSPTQER